MLLPVQRSSSAVTARCFSPAPRARPPMCTSTPTCSGATTKRSCWSRLSSGTIPTPAFLRMTQKMLTSYFYNSLQKNLQKNFTLVDQPGPGVITVAVAIINATGATPGLRSVSLVIPQARILNYAQSLATGHAAFAGSAEAAFKATDSSSGTCWRSRSTSALAVWPANAAQIQWGDAEAAMDYWSLHITQRAVALGAGTPAAASQPSASN